LSGDVSVPVVLRHARFRLTLRKCVKPAMVGVVARTCDVQW
jgi:hypothetical protein